MDQSRAAAGHVDVDATESSIQELCRRQAWREATTLVLQVYGPEIVAYVRAIGPPTVVDQAYSDFAIDLWGSLQRFEWRCSARGYAFTLARRAVQRACREERRTQRLDQAWACERWLLDAIERSRSATPNYLRSEVKTRLRALRDRLPEEERSLLILRIDRGLSFSDLAMVLEPEQHSDADLRKRSEARLRKRFQLLKEKLKRMAVAEGLHQRRE